MIPYLFTFNNKKMKRITSVLFCLGIILGFSAMYSITQHPIPATKAELFRLCLGFGLTGASVGFYQLKFEKKTSIKFIELAILIDGLVLMGMSVLVLFE